MGKLADFVILSDNPLTIDRLKIEEIKVLKTIKEDKIVYDRSTKTTNLPNSCIDSEACLQKLANTAIHTQAFSQMMGKPHNH